jgi:hypothetical protein
MFEGLLTWGDNFHSPFILQYCTLFSTYLHCTENSKQIFPEMKLHGLVLNFCIHVSASDLCIPMIGTPTMLYCVCGPIVAIYKSLTVIYECINWEQGHAVSIWKYLFRNLGTVHWKCVPRTESSKFCWLAQSNVAYSYKLDAGSESCLFL